MALDEELSREVALKRIRRPRAADADSRRRFIREGEITGNLEHPGVVPVYGLTRDADGQPCYVMRFIRGQNLKEAIERYHTSPGPDRGLALRQLLTRFVAVCNTVAYAHSKGIIHRDLKPANIMLGDYGETLVVLLCRLWIDVTCWLPRTPGDRCAEAFSTPEVARKLVLGLDACFPPRMRKS